MKLRLRYSLLLSMLAACAGARTSAAASPTAQCDSPPAVVRPPQVDGLMSARIPVAYPDVVALARVLRDLFEVRPDRGEVRVILHDSRDSTLIVIATREGIEKIRKILGPDLSPAATTATTAK